MRRFIFVAPAALKGCATHWRVVAQPFKAANTHALVDLVEQPLPAGLGEEVRHDGEGSLDARANPIVRILIASGLVRPIDHQGLALDVVTRQETPVAAVL